VPTAGERLCYSTEYSPPDLDKLRPRARYPHPRPGTAASLEHFCESHRLGNFICSFSIALHGLIRQHISDMFRASSLEAFPSTVAEAFPSWKGRTLIHVKDSGNHSLIVGALSTEGGKDEHRATCDE